MNIDLRYPEAIFLSGEILYESEDDDFVRYCDYGHEKSDGLRSILEIVIGKESVPYMFGHYLRYYDMHSKIRRILRYFPEIVIGMEFRFSDDAQEAAVLSKCEKIFIRLQRREVNFYVTHISVLSSDNQRTHDAFISEMRRMFQEPQRLEKIRIDTKTRKAVRKLLGIRSSQIREV